MRQHSRRPFIRRGTIGKEAYKRGTFDIVLAKK
jgi:hypothetical protein